MTERFSRKDFIAIPYEQSDVEAQAISTLVVSEGTQSCADNGWAGFTEPVFTDEAACRKYFVDIDANRITGFVEDWAAQ